MLNSSPQLSFSKLQLQHVQYQLASPLTRAQSFQFCCMYVVYFQMLLILFVVFKQQKTKFRQLNFRHLIAGILLETLFFGHCLETLVPILLHYIVFENSSQMGFHQKVVTTRKLLKLIHNMVWAHSSVLKVKKYCYIVVDFE